ncbi:phage-like protein [Helicobacter cetorum MIT 00-7128]|uniref:Phage-like protein n=1 Tax=Helicobacter cetorum (strain ATCC BAA-429 / MIT 00-7128) TaxID=182217 RepID=I0ELN4_HELC0|nr:phage-like protein [Helicobacter cetorum MIT 00-7128]
MTIKQTTIFSKWLENLKDKKGVSIIRRRLFNIEITNNLGDFKALGSNLFEMRFFVLMAIEFISLLRVMKLFFY